MREKKETTGSFSFACPHGVSYWQQSSFGSANHHALESYGLHQTGLKKKVTVLPCRYIKHRRDQITVTVHFKFKECYIMKHMHLNTSQ